MDDEGPTDHPPSAPGPVLLRDAVGTALRELRDPPVPVGVQTGFADLDALTGGIAAGALWVVAGRSGAGKSVFAGDLARTAAVGRGLPVLIVSRRERTGQLTRRLLAAQGRVPLQHMSSGLLGSDDWSRLDAAAAFVRDAPLRMLTTDEVGADAVAGAAVAMGQADGGLRLLIVDDVPAGDAQSAALVALAGLAAEQGLSVVAVAQRDVRRPEEQLRGFEQLADVVLSVHRDDQDDRRSPRAGEVDLVVSRHRRGPVATVAVAFQGHYGRFVDIGARPP